MVKKSNRVKYDVTAAAIAQSSKISKSLSKSSESESGVKKSNKSNNTTSTMTVSKAKRIHGGSLFMMQIERLLENLTLSSSKGSESTSSENGLEKKMHKLHEMIMGTESNSNDNQFGFKPESIHVNDFASRFPDLAFYNTGINDKAGQKPTLFSKPVRIEVVGSYLLKTGGETSSNSDSNTTVVDISCILSKEMFLGKDHVNYRYHDKRSAFLGLIKEYIEKKISELSDSATVSIKHLDRNIFRPVVVLSFKNENKKSKNNSGGNFAIQITAAPEEGTFSTSKLAMDRNCLRRRLSGESETYDSSTPSPYYNAILLEDMYSVAIRDYQNSQLKTFKNLRKAILLLKRWVKVRFGSSSSSSSSSKTNSTSNDSKSVEFAMALLACHICASGGSGNIVGKNFNSSVIDNSSSTSSTRKSSLHPHSSPLQIFKVVLNFIISRFNKSESCEKYPVLEGSSTLRPVVGQGIGQLRNLKNDRVIMEECREVLEKVGVIGGSSKTTEEAASAASDNKADESTNKTSSTILSKQQFIQQYLEKNLDTSKLSPFEKAVAENEIKEDAEEAYEVYLEKNGGGGQGQNSSTASTSKKGKKGKNKSNVVNSDTGPEFLPVCTSSAHPVAPLNLFFGELDVFYKIPTHQLLELDFEARLSLKQLDELGVSGGGAFESLFGSVMRMTSTSSSMNCHLNWDFGVKYDLHSVLDLVPRWCGSEMMSQNDTGKNESKLSSVIEEPASKKRKKSKGNKNSEELCLAKSSESNPQTEKPLLTRILSTIKNKDSQTFILNDPFFKLESEMIESYSTSINNDDSSESDTFIGDTTPYSHLISDRIIRVLQSGLGKDRVLRAWVRLNDHSLTIGIKLLPLVPEKTVIKGPPVGSSEDANKSEEAKLLYKNAIFYRHLWGNNGLKYVGIEKSPVELRRFKNGSILYCTVWKQPKTGLIEQQDSQSQTITVSGQMIDHLLKVHFAGGVTNNDICVSRRITTGPSGMSYMTPVTLASSMYLAQTGSDNSNLNKEPDTLELRRKFEELRSMMMKMSSEKSECGGCDPLPLGVSRIVGTSRGFSYTEYGGPNVKNNSSSNSNLNTVTSFSLNHSLSTNLSFHNSYKSVEEIVLEFDYSPLWPKEDQEAIKVFQGSFLLEIAEQLRKRYNIEAYVGDEGSNGVEGNNVVGQTQSQSQSGQSSCQPFLDIIFPRHIFRCRVFYVYMPSIEKNAHLITLGTRPRDVAKALKWIDKSGLDGSVTVSETKVEIKEKSENKDDENKESNADEEENSDTNENATVAVQETPTTLPDPSTTNISSLKDLKNLWWRPRIRDGFHTLALEYQSFSATVKLCAMWMASQFCLEDHEDFVEHLVAYVFTTSGSSGSSVGSGSSSCHVSNGDVPTSSDTGFLRFLNVLSSLDDNYNSGNSNLNGNHALLILSHCFMGAKGTNNDKSGNSSGSGIDVLGLERDHGNDGSYSNVGLALELNNSGGSSSAQVSSELAQSAAARATSMSPRQIQMIQEAFNNRNSNSSNAVTVAEGDSSSISSLTICSRFDPHGVFVECPPASKLNFLKRRAKYFLNKSAEHSNCCNFFESPDASGEFDLRIDMKGIKNRNSKNSSSDANSNSDLNFHQHFTESSSILEKTAFLHLKNQLIKRYSEVAIVYSTVLTNCSELQSSENNSISDSKSTSSKFQIGLKWRQEAFLLGSTTNGHGNAMRHLSNAKCPYTQVSDNDGGKVVLPDTRALVQEIKVLAEGLGAKIRM